MEAMVHNASSTNRVLPSSVLSRERNFRPNKSKPRALDPDSVTISCVPTKQVEIIGIGLDPESTLRRTTAPIVTRKLNPHHHL